MRVGLISDTHGLLRPSVHRALAGVELILHAGDVCGELILPELESIAPVQAVMGNCDDWDPALARERWIDLAGLRTHLSHGHEVGAPNAARLISEYPEAQCIIYGHTHRPDVKRLNGVLVVNPGAAGPRRFDLRPTVAVLTVRDGVGEVELIDLDD